MRKKVLIIAYYWPPAGGPGVQRWLKFVKYLPDFNIEPIVFVPDNPNYPITDESLEEEVSESVRIIKFPIKEPYRFAGFLSKKKSKSISRGIISSSNKQSLIEKLLLFIRGNFFIPDARVGWVKPSVGFLTKFIKEERINTIITTGPPHSMHLIGDAIKSHLNINWIADFRDPWTTIGYHKALKLTKYASQKHKKLEQHILNKADSIVVTSSVTKKEFEEITQKPIHVITNGYDYEPHTAFEMDTKFTLSHIGSLLSERNPDVLWQVLRELIDENPKFSKDFQLNLVGFVSDDILKNLERYNLIKHTNNAGYVTHKESVIYQKKSQVLLLIEIDSEETKCIIPGKLFEYMVSNRPILALGPKGSDIKKIITETNTGAYFLYSEYEILKSTILKLYNEFLNKTLKSNPIGLQKYSRKSLTKSLSELL